MEQKVTTPVVKGIIISLILIVIALGLQFAGLSQNKGLGSISFIVLIGGIIWACISYAKQMDGNVSFGNTFAHGFKTTAVITILMVAFTAIIMTFLPEIKEQALDQAMKDMEGKNMSDDQIETGMNLTKKYMMVFLIGGILFIYLVIGLISSLIGAAVAKKNPQGPFQQPG